MNLEETNLSLQFYNYLCNIIGSEEVVQIRRDVFTAKDIVESDDITYATLISSGSKAEGLDLEGSDYDQMININFIRVCESLNDGQSDLANIKFVMESNETKFGYTKLKLVNKSYLLDIDTIHECCEIVGEDIYISSKRFRDRFLVDGRVIHGPCITSASGDYDQAFCFRCTKWIKPAQQWIYRSRKAWPHDALVTASVEYGVLFVPIGCKDSPNEDLQWRISFSVTEKLLIHTFPHTQLLCYALLKIMLKDIIKPRHGDLLCSYFLKTIMFWLSEEIDPSAWKPENMILCVLDCIRRLIYCVEYKTCLHYFIPENNLFEDRFTDNDHKALLDTLRFVYRSPLTSLFNTETFLNYRLQSEYSHWMALSASSLSCFTYLLKSCDSYSIYRTFHLFENCKNRIYRKEIYAYMLCVRCREALRSDDFYNLTDKNKSFYKQCMRIFAHFKISLQSDSITSWLLLASLFYKCKRFRECLHIIKYCVFSCTLDKISLHDDNTLTEQTIFRKMEQRFGLLITFKYLIMNSIMFRSQFSLLPNELKTLIDGDSIDFYPLVYSYVLLFLCYHHIGDNRRKLNALCDLELAVKESYFVYSCTEIWKTSTKCLDIAKAIT